MTTLDQIRADKRVEIVDDERNIGNGIIVTLRRGWTFSPGVDNRVLGEDSVTAMRAFLSTARPFAGPYDA